MELTKAEVEAVIDYLYQHVRASPKGRGYKVWQKMFEFLTAEEPIQESFFEKEEKRRTQRR